jgi:hypothetical protein
MEQSDMNRYIDPDEFELPSGPALVSAADVIDNNMPPELLDLGERIKVSVKKIDNYYITVGQYLAAAKKLCDNGGFEEFYDKYCPKLSRSRIFELVAIGEERKSLADQRAETAKRQREYRERKKAAELAAAGAAFTEAANPAAGSPLRNGLPTDPAVIDAVSALVNLRYKKAQATAMIEAAARTAGDGADTATLIRVALRALARATGSAEVSIEDHQAAMAALDREDRRAEETAAKASPPVIPERLLRAVADALSYLLTKVFDGDRDAMFAAIDQYRASTCTKAEAA